MAGAISAAPVELGRGTAGVPAAGAQRAAGGLTPRHRRPLPVSDPRHRHPLSLLCAAAQQAGYANNDDFNGVRQEGVGFYQTTTANGDASRRQRCF